MLIFDIGANVGNWAIANGEGNTVISVEASPITYETLKNAVKDHSNIKPLHYAVCDSSEPTITFYHCYYDVISTLDKNWVSSPESRFGHNKDCLTEVQVPVISLDKLIDAHGVPDLLKIDVEGAENIVLRSLSRKTPMLCFEWAAEWRSKNLECIDLLVSLGYTKFCIQREDSYTFRPELFDLTDEGVKKALHGATDKVDWGMIWAK